MRILAQAFETIEKQIGESFTFTTEQKNFLYEVGNEQSVLLTTSAGTGRGIALLGAVLLLEKTLLPEEIVIFSATRQSVDRLSDLLDRKVYQVHNEYNCVNMKDVKAVIVDDVQLVGLSDLWRLLKGIPQTVQLILLADKKQIYDENSRYLVDILSRFMKSMALTQVLRADENPLTRDVQISDDLWSHHEF